jgi:hypothetical protein
MSMSRYVSVSLCQYVFPLSLSFSFYGVLSYLCCIYGFLSYLCFIYGFFIVILLPYLYRVRTSLVKFVLTVSRLIYLRFFYYLCGSLLISIQLLFFN